MIGPNPNELYPNPAIRSVAFIKNCVTNPNIIIGDYTYYNDPDGPENFEAHVEHLYDFLGDKLIIGKFCAIAKGITFIMNGANHRMASATTYPFNIMGAGFEKVTPQLSDLPFKGDTIVGNDVWIGQNVTVMPGVQIGDGAIIAANSVVTKNVGAYEIYGGNPARKIKDRFSKEITLCLKELAWWDFPNDKLSRNLEILCDTDLTLEKLQKIK